MLGEWLNGKVVLGGIVALGLGVLGFLWKVAQGIAAKRVQSKAEKILDRLTGTGQPPEKPTAATPEKPAPPPDPRIAIIAGYTTDTIEGLVWRWRWKGIDPDSPRLGTVLDLTAFCPRCSRLIEPEQLLPKREVYARSQPPMVIYFCKGEKGEGDFSKAVAGRREAFEAAVDREIRHRARGLSQSTSSPP
jgi:hypothetical protein